LKLPNLKSRALGLAVITMVAGAHAADTGVGAQTGAFSVSVEPPRPQPAFFWERFDDGFGDHANDIFSDALQPLNAIRWNLDLPGRDFGVNFRERASSRARNAFGKSVEYGTREAAMEMPFMIWLDEHQGWLASLVRDSVGNVDEEAVAPLGLTYRGVEQSWWRSMAAGETHYGVRPFRTSPYAYLSHGITDGEKTILLANVRYYYDRFSNHRVELALSLPIAYGMALDFGSSYQFGTRDEHRVAVKIVKQLKTGGIAQLGFEARQHPTLIAGISFAW
jgi:hypothetical protein